MSDGMSNLEARIAEFEGLLEEMKTETREAHSVLKQVRKERQAIEKLLDKDIKALVDEKIGELVKKELEDVGEKLSGWSESLYGKVNEQVDKLVDICLGPEFAISHKRKDLRPELAAKMRVWVREVIRGDYNQ